MTTTNLVCVCSAVILLLLATTAQAATWYVRPNGDGTGTPEAPFGAITTALQAAAANDIIMLYPGNYSGLANNQIDLSLKNNISILSVEGPRTTRLICVPTAFALYVGAPGIAFRVEGLTIEGCRNAPGLYNLGHSIVRNCYFQNINAASYGAIFSGNGSVFVEDCRFLNNVGGAVFSQSSTFTMRNSILYRNTAADNLSGGIYATGSILNITDNIFSRNTGALNLVGGTTTIRNNKFGANTATGVNLYTLSCTAAITHSGNFWCGVAGNAIRTQCGISGTYLTQYDNCGICNGDNSHRICNGDCFSFPPEVCPTFRKIYVSANSTAAAQDGTKTAPYKTLLAAINAAASFGDTIIMMPGTYTGPGNTNIIPVKKDVTITSECNDPADVIIDCQSASGFMSIENGQSPDFVFRGITIQRCAAGAVVVLAESAVTLDNCVLRNNLNQGGGALWIVDGHAFLKNSALIDNTVGGGYLYGGAVLVQRNIFAAALTAVNTRFEGNRASSGGGAIRVDIGGYVRLTNCYFMNNTAQAANNGGAISIGSVLPSSIIGSSFWANGAQQSTTSARSVYCESGAVVQQNTNSFCSQTDVIVQCGGWTAPTPTSIFDKCSVCDGIITNRTDCDDTCWGSKTNDSFSGCCRDCDKDCFNRCFGPGELDLQNTCCNSSLINPADGLCCFGYIDRCGVCNGTDACVICEPPCQNGGVCEKAGSVLYCNCSATGGYNGDDCTNFTCTPRCLNGGTCVAPNNCSCPLGYFGDDCGSSTCGSLTCYHGGICVPATSSCDCSTTGGYFGEECDNFTCTTPCGHGGECVAPDLCDCDGTGYEGNACNTPVCYGSQGCLNGGRCVAPNQCDCTGTDHSGDACETPDYDPPVKSSATVIFIKCSFSLVLLYFVL